MWAHCVEPSRIIAAKADVLWLGQREAEEAALTEARRQAFEDRKQALERARLHPPPAAIVVDTGRAQGRKEDGGGLDEDVLASGEHRGGGGGADVTQDLCAFTRIVSVDCREVRDEGEEKPGGRADVGGREAGASAEAEGLAAVLDGAGGGSAYGEEAAAEVDEEIIEVEEEEDLAKMEAAEEEDDDFGAMLGDLIRVLAPVAKLAPLAMLPSQ